MSDVATNVVAILLIYGVPLAAIGYGLWLLNRIMQELKAIRRSLERTPSNQAP